MTARGAESQGGPKAPSTMSFATMSYAMSAESSPTFEPLSSGYLPTHLSSSPGRSPSPIDLPSASWKAPGPAPSTTVSAAPQVSMSPRAAPFSPLVSDEHSRSRPYSWVRGYATAMRRQRAPLSPKAVPFTPVGPSTPSDTDGPTFSYRPKLMQHPIVVPQLPALQATHVSTATATATAKVDTRLRKLEQQLASQQLEIGELKDENAVLSSAVDQAGKTVETLTTELRRAEEMTLDIEKDMHMQHFRYARASEELEKAFSAAMSSKVEGDPVPPTCKSHTSEMESAREVQKMQSTSITALTGQVASLDRLMQATTSTTSKDVQAVSETLSQQAQKIETLNAALETTSERANVQQKTIEEQSNHINQLQADLRDFQASTKAEQKRTQQQSTERNSCISNVTTKIEDMAKRIDELVAVVDARCAALEAKIDSQTGRVEGAAYQDQCHACVGGDNKEGKLVTLRDDLSKLVARVSHLESKEGAADERFDKLNDAAHSVKMEHDALKRSLKKSEAKRAAGKTNVNATRRHESVPLILLPLHEQVQELETRLDEACGNFEEGRQAMCVMGLDIRNLTELRDEQVAVQTSINRNHKQDIDELKRRTDKAPGTSDAQVNALTTRVDELATQCTSLTRKINSVPAVSAATSPIASSSSGSHNSDLPSHLPERNKPKAASSTSFTIPMGPPRGKKIPPRVFPSTSATTQAERLDLRLSATDKEAKAGYYKCRGCCIKIPGKWMWELQCPACGLEYPDDATWSPDPAPEADAGSEG